MLQPLPHVALVRAGSLGELARGSRTALVQRPVQPEPFAQVDGVELERPGGVAEESIGEGLGRIGHGLDDATPRAARGHDRGRNSAFGALIRGKVNRWQVPCLWPGSQCVSTTTPTASRQRVQFSAMLEMSCWWVPGLEVCHGVVTSRAKRVGTGGDDLRRFMHVSGI